MENLDKWIKELEQKYNDDKYYFDTEEATKFYNFISRLELDKGKKNEKIKLLKFQFDICTSILCVKRKDDRLRRFREAHINIPRKNGKSFLIACIMSYCYFCKNEFGSELLIAANTSQQASLLFNTIHHMVKTNKSLVNHARITDSRKYMYRESMNSYLRVISSDASNADSFASFIAVLDEIHESPNRKLYDKIKTGMGIWKEPCMVTITTKSSGQDINNLEYELYTYSKAIESGEIDDDSFFYAIYEADKGCDLLDEEQWYKANPALGEFRSYEELKSLAIRSTKIKTQEAAFRRLYLNQHVSLDGETAINMNLWQNCIEDVKLEELYNLPCWAGLDMSSTQDITAFVQVFYDEKIDKFYIYPHLYTPKDTIPDRSERDNVRYDLHVKQDYLTALDGKYMNFQQLQKQIRVIDGQFEISELAYDAWGAEGVLSALEDDFKVVRVGQDARVMSPIIRDFENLLIDERLIIANNPVFTWMAGNVVAVEGSTGQIRYDKRRCKNKIDGIIAMLMALSRAIANVYNGKVDLSKYATKDYLTRFYGD